MTENRYDVVVIGGGIAGMSTAARLQASGLSTVVVEQHEHIGGCAGYYRTDGFSFDVGATTLIDFHADGVGGQFFDDVGFQLPDITVQDAYEVWLPDRRVTLYQSVGDILRNASAAKLTDLTLVRYLRWTMADALRAYDVYDKDPLRETISLLVEDAVHSTIEEAPLLNSVLGITLRRTGIARATGGMYRRSRRLPRG